MVGNGRIVIWDLNGVLVAKVRKWEDREEFKQLDCLTLPWYRMYIRPGIIDTLEKLLEKDIALAIWTSNPGDRVKLILEQLRAVNERWAKVLDSLQFVWTREECTLDGHLGLKDLQKYHDSKFAQHYKQILFIDDSDEKHTLNDKQHILIAEPFTVKELTKAIDCKNDRCVYNMDYASTLLHVILNRLVTVNMTTFTLAQQQVRWMLHWITRAGPNKTITERTLGIMLTLEGAQEAFKDYVQQGYFDVDVDNGDFYLNERSNELLPETKLEELSDEENFIRLHTLWEAYIGRVPIKLPTKRPSSEELEKFYRHEFYTPRDIQFRKDKLSLEPWEWRLCAAIYLHMHLDLDFEFKLPGYRFNHLVKMTGLLPAQIREPSCFLLLRPNDYRNYRAYLSQQLIAYFNQLQLDSKQRLLAGKLIERICQQFIHQNDYDTEFRVFNDLDLHELHKEYLNSPKHKQEFLKREQSKAKTIKPKPEPKCVKPPAKPKVKAPIEFKTAKKYVSKYADGRFAKINELYKQRKAREAREMARQEKLCPRICKTQRPPHESYVCCSPVYKKQVCYYHSRKITICK